MREQTERSFHRDVADVQRNTDRKCFSIIDRQLGVFGRMLWLVRHKELAYFSNKIIRTPSRQKIPPTINASYLSNNSKCRRCDPSSVNHVKVTLPRPVPLPSLA